LSTERKQKTKKKYVLQDRHGALAISILRMKGHNLLRVISSMRLRRTQSICPGLIRPSLTKTETIANPFEYVGQYGVMDEGNGLDFMRARFYTPVEGRFMNLDPIGIAGGLNLYNYTKNSPSNLIDPSGLCSEDTFDVNDRIKQAGIGLVNAAAGAAALYAALGTAPITGGASLLLSIPAAYSYTAGIAQISGAIFNQDLSSISGGLFTDFGKAGDSVFGGSKDGSPGPGETLGGIADLPFGGASRFQKIEQLNRLKDVPGRILEAGKRAESIQRSLNTVSAGNSFLGTLDRLDSDPNTNICPPGISGKPQATSQTTNVFSCDPNDIIGPSGFGDQNWLTPAQTLPYIIHFENQATATAAAVFITITHTLDADLDLTTFELGDFGFGDLYIDIPQGFQSYTTRLDLRDTISD
jgi:RHS repeat-associated protein